MFDPISDMLTRIRNAQKSGKKEVIFPFSKLKLFISQILEKEGFVELVRMEKDGNHENIHLSLKYKKISNTQKLPAITEMGRVSRIGQRIYVKKDEIKKVKNGYGILIISTSKGIMTGKEAKKIGLGGEIICQVW